MNYDFLIVGQGVAGTVLSYKLMQNNQSVCIIDNNHHLSSSKIAAGLVNPITGRRYVKSWRIDQLIPESINTYTELESLLKIQILHHANIIRTIPNREAQLNWERIELDDSASKYIVDKPSLGKYERILHPVFDYGELTNSFRVDLRLLLDSFRKHLENDNRIINEQFDHNELTFEEGLIKYRGVSAKNIIFCEGSQATKNPLFNYLPFQPAKGESIIFKLDGFDATKILRNRTFIVPFGQNRFWSGGGYDWKNFDDETTSKFQEDWLKLMTELITISPEIIEHKAAVRPAVKGRRPLIGNHPKLKNVYIFNGMGTKGASLVPFWANNLVDSLLNAQPIDEDVNITRFASLWV